MKATLNIEIECDKQRCWPCDHLYWEFNKNNFATPFCQTFGQLTWVNGWSQRHSECLRLGAGIREKYQVPMIFSNVIYTKTLNNITKLLQSKSNTKE